MVKVLTCLEYTVVMNTRFWEELGGSGVKLLLAVYEIGPDKPAYAYDILARARMGRTAWYRLLPILAKYGLCIVEEKPQRVMLTEKGKRIAELLAEIDRISTSS